VTDGAPIEQEGGGHGVTENVCTDAFVEPCSTSVDGEGVFDAIGLVEATGTSSLGHKKRFVIIPASGKITLNPDDGAIREEERPLLVPLPDDLRLFAHGIDVDTVERERLGNPGPRSKQCFDEGAEAYARQGHLVPCLVRRDDGVDKARNLLGGEIDDVAFGDTGDTYLPWVECGDVEHVAAECEEGAQRIHDRGDPPLLAAAFFHLAPDGQEVAEVQTCDGLILYISDDPLEPFAVPDDGRRRSAHLVACPFEKEWDEHPDGEDDLGLRCIGRTSMEHGLFGRFDDRIGLLSKIFHNKTPPLSS